jgi:hypothetical protein
MSATGARTTDGVRDGHTTATRRPDAARRLTTETKSSFKTTEFFAFLAVAAAILIAALVADDDGGAGFGAKAAWLYVTVLTVGYMVSRGLAKSGSRDPYDDHDRH